MPLGGKKFSEALDEFIAKVNVTHESSTVNYYLSPITDKSPS